MTEYSILLEAADGVRTRQWLPYASDADAIADWLPRSAGKRVEIMAAGRIVAHWDKKEPAGQAA
jgi:hypothetical protein